MVDSVLTAGSFCRPATESETLRRRVYVLDDDLAVLTLLERMLEQFGFEVQAFQSPGQFVIASESLPPGVVITDHVMDQMTGIEVQQKLSARPGQFRVILFSGYPRTSVAVTAMKAGAITVLDKPFERGQLLEAIDEGFRQLDAAELPDTSLPPGLSAGETYLSRLSERELQVIQMVYDGATNKSIGISLGISIKTVEKHRGRGMKKMGVRCLASLIRLMDRELGRS
jgi:two-component system response regulator FixJ